MRNVARRVGRTLQWLLARAAWLITLRAQDIHDRAIFRTEGRWQVVRLLAERLGAWYRWGTYEDARYPQIADWLYANEGEFIVTGVGHPQEWYGWFSLLEGAFPFGGAAAILHEDCDGYIDYELYDSYQEALGKFEEIEEDYDDFWRARTDERSTDSRELDESLDLFDTAMALMGYERYDDTLADKLELAGEGDYTDFAQPEPAVGLRP